MLHRLFMEANGPDNADDYDCNEKFIKWLEEQRESKKSFVFQSIDDVNRDSIVSDVRNSLEVN